MQFHFNATERELEIGATRSIPLIMHAATSGEEQLGRVKRIGPAVHISVESDCRILGCGLTAVAVNASGGNAIFEH